MIRGGHLSSPGQNHQKIKTIKREGGIRVKLGGKKRGSQGGFLTVLGKTEKTEDSSL